MNFNEIQIGSVEALFNTLKNKSKLNGADMKDRKIPLQMFVYETFAVCTFCQYFVFPRSLAGHARTGLIMMMMLLLRSLQSAPRCAVFWLVQSAKRKASCSMWKSFMF